MRVADVDAGGPGEVDDDVGEQAHGEEAGGEEARRVVVGHGQQQHQPHDRLAEDDHDHVAAVAPSVRHARPEDDADERARVDDHGHELRLDGGPAEAVQDLWQEVADRADARHRRGLDRDEHPELVVADDQQDLPREDLRLARVLCAAGAPDDQLLFLLGEAEFDPLGRVWEEEQDDPGPSDGDDSFDQEDPPPRQPAVVAVDVLLDRVGDESVERASHGGHGEVDGSPGGKFIVGIPE